MPIYLLSALSLSLVLAFVWELTGRKKSDTLRRLEELEQRRKGGKGESAKPAAGRRLLDLLSRVGERVKGGEKGARAEKNQKALDLAGLRSPGAAALFHASRLVAAIALFALSVLFTLVIGKPVLYGIFGGVYLGLGGLFLPRLWLRSRIKSRQANLRKALADTLDLLVVCVEAGLGLNQALVRVGEDADRFSPAMSDEMRVLNLEIRAGTPRAIALRNLGERTGVDDLRSLAAMLIQADRFGTSIGSALRVHAAALRTKRRQRAEEAAAKTTIKLVFPLVLFIFPSIFVVILGPVVIRMIDQFAK